MKLKAVTGILLTLLFIGVSTLAFNIKPAKATVKIYIMADGSVAPPTAPISTVDYITYTFTGDINWPSYDGILVQRDNIVVDGAGYTVRGIEYEVSMGIYLPSRSNVTIKNVKIRDFYCGIYLSSSSNNSIYGNYLTDNYGGVKLYQSFYNELSENAIINNDNGIFLESSSNNKISGNNITGTVSFYGIGFDASSNNTISGNDITNNQPGVKFLFEAPSDNNTFYHNNFINNSPQVGYDAYRLNVWDNGYPSGGNYWSNYTGVDANMDGIGDSPHEIDANNTDRYPLMGMFSDFPATTLAKQTYHVTTVCNSSITLYQYDALGRLIRFNVTGPDYTVGFCRICIPHDLMEPPYVVTIDGYSPQYVNYTLYDNGTHRWTYFTYQHSTHEVMIASPVGGIWVPVNKLALLVPYIALASTILAATAATAIYVKRRKKRQ